MVAIVNYGSGNVHAIGNIYHKLGIPYVITHREEELFAADKLILPGVGAFDTVMSALNESGLRPVLDELVLVEQRPILGICVGMQILGESSDEGLLCGLGWIKGRIKKMPIMGLTHKPYLPHMGWNQAIPAKESPILEGLNLELGFYFLHSYCFECQDPANVLTTTNYGTTFTSAVNKGNIFGTQFHPEKSHSNGILIFKNFAELD